MPGLMDAKALAVKSYLTTEAPPKFRGPSVSTQPRHNLTAVGAGRKYIDGKPTDTHAVRFYVERKLPMSSIPKEQVLPKEIGGVPTDVIQMGRFELCAAAAFPAPVTGRFRPVQPGCSCSFQAPPPDQGMLTASTIGAIVQAGGKTFILSNNHALANANALPAGTPIFHPGLLDQPDLTTDQIAALTSFVPISANGNVVDCAIAELLDGVPFSSEILPDVGRLSTAQPIAAVEGMTVVKAGRTISATVGTVVEINGTVPVLYQNVGIVTFDSQIFVQDMNGPFSDAGDSGALVGNGPSFRQDARRLHSV